MSHLLEQGYRNIGHISGPMDWWESRQRMNVWKDALKKAGLQYRDVFWAERIWSSASGDQAVEKLLQQCPEMDSVFLPTIKWPSALFVARVKGG